MDMTIGHMLHQMTLSFLEFEKSCTAKLSTEEKSFQEALEYFTNETVLITSSFNKDLLDHFKYVTVWTLARLLGSKVDGFSWLADVFPVHYNHPNSNTSAMKSLIFTQKPLNLSENSNRDMLLILDILQKQYLNAASQRASDPTAFKRDIKIIYSKDVTQDIREAAEQRIKVEIKKAGVAILHGDLLTDVRFETCKRLKR